MDANPNLLSLANQWHLDHCPSGLWPDCTRVKESGGFGYESKCILLGISWIPFSAIRLLCAHRSQFAERPQRWSSTGQRTLCRCPRSPQCPCDFSQTAKVISTYRPHGPHPENIDCLSSARGAAAEPDDAKYAQTPERENGGRTLLKCVEARDGTRRTADSQRLSGRPATSCGRCSALRGVSARRDHKSTTAGPGTWCERPRHIRHDAMRCTGASRSATVVMHPEASLGPQTTATMPTIGGSTAPQNCRSRLCANRFTARALPLHAASATGDHASLNTCTTAVGVPWPPGVGGGGRSGPPPLQSKQVRHGRRR